MHIYTYIYIHTHIYIYTHTHIYIYIYADTHIYITFQIMEIQGVEHNLSLQTYCLMFFFLN